MKSILIFLIVLFFSNTLIAQTKTEGKRKLICKTWRLYKYLSQDKAIFNLTPDQMMQASITYYADGTFEDKEVRATYTGKWVFNPTNNSITLTQTKSKDYPAKMELKILMLTDTEFDTEANDFKTGIITIYMNTEK